MHGFRRWIIKEILPCTGKACVRYDVYMHAELQGPKPALLVLFDGIQVRVEDLVHGEHVDAVLLEDGAHGIVAADLALVAGVLEVARFDVLPDLLDGLRSGELEWDR